MNLANSDPGFTTTQKRWYKEMIGQNSSTDSRSVKGIEKENVDETTCTPFLRAEYDSTGQELMFVMEKDYVNAKSG